MNRKVLAVAALACAAAAVALMAVRGFSAISFAEPLQAGTKGAEYESLYGIWKVINGERLYTDQNSIPFAGFYYNWLFYHFYAWVTGAVLSVAGLGDAWLPTVARLTGVAGLIAGVAVMYASMRRLLDLDDGWIKALALATSVYVFFGPLMGFFGIATVPDIWPLVLTAAGIWLFQARFEARPVVTILGVCLLAYLCWGFKQHFLLLPASVGLYLLINRRWGLAALLTLICVAAAAATLAAGDPVYRKMLLFGGSAVYLSGQQLWANVLNVAPKLLPIVGALAAVAGLWLLRRLRGEAAPLDWSHPIMVVYLGAALAFVQAVLSSSLIYAAENHYFFFAYFAAFAFVALLASLRRQREPGTPVYGVAMLSWLAGLAAIVVVLAGAKGTLSVRPVHEQLMRDKACLGVLAEPVYVVNPYLSLPWMLDVEERFVTHMNYPSDRAAGVEKERGGIGGLIDEGYFKTIVVPATAPPFDGSALTRYERRNGTCGAYAVYDRRDGAAPAQ